jgi:hypothetical protein
MEKNRINAGRSEHANTPPQNESPMERDRKILEGEIAQDILPYLTINELSNHETAQTIQLADNAINTIFNSSTPHNPFFLLSTMDMEIAIAANESNAWRNHEVPTKLSEARKVFCASLLHHFNTSDLDQRGLIRNTFFASSPDSTSYCGGLTDSLELLDIADRIEGYNPCSSNITEEIILDYSFSDYNAFEDTLLHSSPIKQAQLLPIINNILSRCDPDNYSRVALHKIINSYKSLYDSPYSTPFIKILSGSFYDKALKKLNTEWVEIDLADPYYQDLIKKDKERRRRATLEQAALHHDFPSLPKEATLRKIAPNIAASVSSSNRLNLIADKHHAPVSLLNYSDNSIQNINQEDALLLSSAHNPDIKHAISSSLNLDLADIPLSSQIQLLRFMTEAGSDRFDRLSNTLNNTDKKLRLKLAENFLSADFGDDFGDSLLEIASSEHLTSEQKSRFLDTMSDCRESISEITSFYSGFDNQFSREYARAANERLTDATTVFRELAKGQSVSADLSWAGEAKFDYDSALEALTYEANSLAIISGTVTDTISGVDGCFVERVLTPDEEHQRAVYNFYSPNHGYTLLYVRPEGSSSFDPRVEYGRLSSRYNENSRNAGVEASISFIVDPVSPFNLPSPYKPRRSVVNNPSAYDESTMNKVSAIRLDREGRSPDMLADDPNRSPITPEGMVSVDLAAIGDRADTPSGKIARLIAVGNKLRAQSKTDFSLNHNTKWFNQSKYGSSSGFQKIANYIMKSSEALCFTHPPQFDQGYTALTRSSRRRQNFLRQLNNRRAA